jgi:hypothetical protein
MTRSESAVSISLRLTNESAKLHLGLAIHNRRSEDACTLQKAIDRAANTKNSSGTNEVTVRIAGFCERFESLVTATSTVVDGSGRMC